MTTTELAELFLVKLYDLAESEGHEKSFALAGIAEEVGVTDLAKIFKVAYLLKDRGLIIALFIMEGPLATISSKGCLLVESGGETGIIRKFRDNPAVVYVNQSTTIHGNVNSSNVTAHSSHVTCNFNANESTLIEQMFSALAKDKALSDAEREDARRDLEILKLQLSKSKKDSNFISSTLSNLANIATLAPFATQILKALIPC